MMQGRSGISSACRIAALRGNIVFKASIISGFILLMFLLRAADSFLTYTTLNIKPESVQELNPFAKTDSLLAVFFSPIPFIVSVLSILQFALMFSFPEKVLQENVGGRLWRHLVNDGIEFPLMMLTWMLLVNVQNTFLLFLDRPLVPKLVDDFMFENPIIGLLILLSIIWFLLGGLYRKITIRMLVYVYSEKQ